MHDEVEEIEKAHRAEAIVSKELFPNDQPRKRLRLTGKRNGGTKQTEQKERDGIVANRQSQDGIDH